MSVEAKVVTAKQVLACPKISLAVGHYRDDGTCRCDEEKEDE